MLKARGNKLKLDEILRQQESVTLEFKREIRLASDRDKYEFTKDVSAFANTKGGHIVYGKEDKNEGGRVLGIHPETYDDDQMQQIIASRCNPPPVFLSSAVKSRGKWFVIVEILESKVKPVEITHNREVWVRRGATCDKATQQEREQMRPRVGKRTPEERLAIEGIPEEESENWLRKSIIYLGRKYMIRKYGRLDVAIRKELIGLLLLGLIFLIPIFYVVFDITFTHEIPPQWVLWLGVLLVVPGMISFYAVEGIPRLYCPFCKRQFAVRRIKRSRIRQRILERTDEGIVREVIYHDIYMCEFCKHRNEKFKPVTETVKV